MDSQRIISFLNRLFREDSHAKIISILVSIIIWFLVVIGANYEYVTSIPIKIRPQNDDYVITNPVPGEAKVHLEGQGKTLLSFLLFKEGWLQLNIDWSAGRHVISINKEDIFLTRDAKQLSARQLLQPDSIVLEIEQRVVRQIPVKNQVSLEPVMGYTIVGDPMVYPSMVDVAGPETQVEAIDSINTVEQTWDELKYPIEREVELVPPENEHIDIAQSQVIVSADVQKLMEKRITTVTVEVKNVPEGVNAIVIPSKLSLIIQGGVNQVFPITAEDIDAYVDYQEEDTSRVGYPVELEPIEGIQFRNIEPQYFKVVLEKTG